jgi:uncharacterized membrane protein
MIIVTFDEANNNITQEYKVILPDIIPVNITPDIIFINETNSIIITVNGTAEGFNATFNNFLTKDVTVGGMPDLVVTAIEVPYVSSVGSDINITVYVENKGLYTDMSFNVGLMINSEVKGNKTITLTDNKASVLFNWISEETGRYILKCTADVGGIIDEADETNNFMKKEIRVLDNSTLGLGPGYGGGTGGGSAGGGTIPLLLVIFLIIMLVLLYHGHRSEKRLLDEARDYIGPYKRFFKKK